MTKTTAQHIRTGHVITTDYGQPRMLEVAYPVLDRFTNPEGMTMTRTRFAGWIVTGGAGIYERRQWVENGFGCTPASRVYVLDDLRKGVGYTYGAL